MMHAPQTTSVAEQSIFYINPKIANDKPVFSDAHDLYLAWGDEALQQKNYYKALNNYEFASILHPNDGLIRAAVCHTLLLLGLATDDPIERNDWLRRCANELDDVLRFMPNNAAVNRVLDIYQSMRCAGYISADLDSVMWRASTMLN